MFGEDHRWARDQMFVAIIFPQQQIYIQAWNILNVSIKSSIIHLNMYKETIPMDTNINNCTWNLNDKLNILDKLLDKWKKLTTKEYKPYLNWMFEEYHHWPCDQMLVPTIFPKQKYISKHKIY